MLSSVREEMAEDIRIEWPILKSGRQFKSAATILRGKRVLKPERWCSPRKQKVTWWLTLSSCTWEYGFRVVLNSKSILWAHCHYDCIFPWLLKWSDWLKRVGRTETSKWLSGTSEEGASSSTAALSTEQNHPFRDPGTVYWKLSEGVKEKLIFPYFKIECATWQKA